MSEISRFYGIIITMYFADHNPPHFHVRYGQQIAAVRIHDLTVTAGRLPPRVLGLVIEWAAKHHEELLNDWDLVQNDLSPIHIQPLD